MKFDEPLIVRLGQGIPLSLDVRGPVTPSDLQFTQGLHRVQRAHVLFLYQGDIPRHRCETIILYRLCQKVMYKQPNISAKTIIA